jgi:hypothetical protein
VIDFCVTWILFCSAVELQIAGKQVSWCAEPHRKFKVEREKRKACCLVVWREEKTLTLLVLERRVDADAVGRQHVSLYVLHADGRQRCQRATAYSMSIVHNNITIEKKNKKKTKNSVRTNYPKIQTQTTNKLVKLILNKTCYDFVKSIDLPSDVPSGGV